MGAASKFANYSWETTASATELKPLSPSGSATVGAAVTRSWVSTASRASSRLFGDNWRARRRRRSASFTEETLATRGFFETKFSHSWEMQWGKVIISTRDRFSNLFLTNSKSKTDCLRGSSTFALFSPEASNFLGRETNCKGGYLLSIGCSTAARIIRLLSTGLIITLD